MHRQSVWHNLSMNVLLLPLYGLGDTLMTTPALEILKKSLNVNVTYLCMFKVNFEILKNNPFIDNLVFFPFMEKNKFDVLKFLLSLRRKFNYSINFYPSNRWQYNFLSWFIGADYRIGHRYIKRDLRELNFLKNLSLKENKDLHNVEENVRLLKFLGIQTNEIPPVKVYLTEEEKDFGREFVSYASKKEIKIGIHTGTSSFKGHIKRRWEKDKFLELINSFPEFDFFIFGTHEEEIENSFIFEQAKHKNVILVHDKPIREVAAIIRQTNLFISNDSGIMHLASSVGIPIVAIFGPTNPKWVKPWGVKNKVVRVNLPCSPCFYYSPKPLKCKNKIEFQCLKDIDVSMVKKAVDELISEKVIDISF